MSTIDHQLLMTLMDTIPDRIYFKDRHARFLSVNKAMKEFMGVTTDEQIQGKTDHDFFLPEHADEALSDENRVIATGQPLVAKVEQEIMPDGRITYTSTTKIPMRNENGEITGTCGISRDVTEEHQKTRQMLAYAGQLAEKQAQMEQELILARQIQLALLPQKYPVFPQGVADQESAWKFSHLYLPNGLVGGDFFTVMPVSTNEVGVLICDVMGHGVHAALVTAVERILVEDLQAWAGDPGVFLRELNCRLRKIFENVQTPLFVTGLYVVLNAHSGTVRFANAGHPHPLHVCRSKQEVRILGGKHQPNAFALGVADDSVYVTQEAVISLGDRLLLFTDGLCDLGGDDAFMRDDQRFLDLVQSCTAVTGDRFLEAIVEKVKQLAGEKNFFDDVCLVGVDWERVLQGDQFLD